MGSWMPSCMIFSVKDCPQRRAVGGSGHCTKKQSGHELMSTIRQELHLKCKASIVETISSERARHGCPLLGNIFGFSPTMFAVFVGT
ncbi:UNVERIFIED_CONTAM: hypothetical protein Sradi_7257600 [Sesamum radiatum]|uniref:Uncharacterized protein n=1 Tax=Sesamum radiatum TaxID=300843 RepID=A0AAW2IL73_SESRA